MSRVVTALVLGLAIVGCSKPDTSPQPKPANPGNPDDGDTTDSKAKSPDMDPAAVEAQDKSIKFVEGMKGKMKRAGKPIVEVDLSFKPITNAELKELAGLKYLQVLNLNYTQVTDEGIQELTAFKNLTTLNLRATKVTGATMRQLSSLKNLTTMDLHVTLVDDAGLREIASIKTLTSLNIQELFDDSAEGVQELQRLLPKCKINSKWLRTK